LGRQLWLMIRDPAAGSHFVVVALHGATAAMPRPGVG
jgi:hypothetical protein